MRRQLCWSYKNSKRTVLPIGKDGFICKVKINHVVLMEGLELLGKLWYNNLS